MYFPKISYRYHRLDEASDLQITHNLGAWPCTTVRNDRVGTRIGPDSSETFRSVFPPKFSNGSG